MSQLPIKSVLSEIQLSLSVASQVILQAPPGAGKSTFLPFVMLKDKWFSGKIIMLEPRRLATKNIAHYIASLFSEEVGGRVGYRMRGEQRISRNTQLEIVTEGVLTQMLQQDAELTGVSLLIFDEFHERNLQADLALALALDAQAGLREDLKVLIMSATLDNSHLQKKLPNAHCILSQGRGYPIEIYHQALNKTLNLMSALVALITRAYREQKGDILVFVAGIKEIKQCTTQLKVFFENVMKPPFITPLYGALSLEAQQFAMQIAAGGQRKIVIATNIAETSLTIAGITVVVDSGQERVALYQAKSGVTKLQTQMISQASATQRAGRAGRLQAGYCYRLWALESRLPAQKTLSIQCSDLTSLLLEILYWGVNDAINLPFIDQPNSSNLAQARVLLTTFGALDASGRLSRYGRVMRELGTEPRYAHLLLQAQRLEDEEQWEGLVELGCLLVAHLESTESKVDDISVAILQPSYLTKQRQRVLLKRLHRSLSSAPLAIHACGLLLAFAFPDRIAGARGATGCYLLSNGIGAQLASHSALLSEKMLVVADLGLLGSARNSHIFSACAIERADLDKYLSSYFIQKNEIYWQLNHKKLIAEERLYIGKLLISSKPLQGVSRQQKSDALLAGIKKSGLSVLNWSAQDEQLLCRLQYAQAQYLKFNVQNDFLDFSHEQLLLRLGDWLGPYLNALTKPDQLARLDLQSALLARLSWTGLTKFKNDFPTHIRVVTGSKIAIKYHSLQNPLLSVRMQELFGQKDSPCIFSGRITLQLALLSPGRRALQLTQDLASFWSGAYIEVKKEMRGRYPKHYWPDDPLQALPTKRIKKHMNGK
ncbi:ATP-dependent helicase HrpB [Psychromonas sp. CD1]|uniref:ATP-dependent helicase HrpB n=1 Tax=Psychromonas sp. CD1 TaxID=1979839 RepID=UPI000B9A46BA|nr:ATP-dependent helicase HrpB [Psychromonas sp. CD1]